MANMAEQAQWDHQQQMARVVQEAQEALARQSHEARALLETQAQSYAAEAQNYQNQVQAAATAARAAGQVASFTSSTRIQQLAMALRLKENEHLQLLARRQSPPTSSAPSSARDDDYLGFHSDSAERPMPDNPSSHRLNVLNPFAHVYKAIGHIGNTFSKGAAPESTNALSTAGYSGSQSSQTWVFPQDLSDAAALSPAVPPEQLGHTQTIMEQPTLVQCQQTTADEADELPQPTQQPPSPIQI